jgi:hypothetical protein
VLASFGTSQAASVRKKWTSSNLLKLFIPPLLSVSVILSVALGYFGIPKRSSSVVGVIGQPAEIEVSSNDSGDLPVATGCSEEDLRVTLIHYEPTRDDNKSISGYKALPSQDLGGALLVDFVCEDSKTKDVFRSMWMLVNKNWHLKAISRPPSRQPGDF